MRLTTGGAPHNFSKPIVGRVTRSATSDRARAILLSFEPMGDFHGYAGVITPGEELHASCPSVTRVREIDHLRDGDVVAIGANGHIRTLYRPDSPHNALFVTERCNSNCLMCSQPPKDHDDLDHFLAINMALIDLISPETRSLGITGGEPTLLRDGLLTLLARLRDRLPTTHVHLLTNGRLFAWAPLAAKLAAISHPDLVLGIPLYSDSPGIHDYVVQAKHAFDQTVMGLHQLARHDVSVEIRIVLHRATIPRLRELAEFVYRNLPFAVHVAFMGLEPTGYTPFNREALWIDPFDYQAILAQAVEALSMRGMNVSVYNLQKCVLPRSLWPFAKQSISDWKNIYLPACETCAEKRGCAGFFHSAQKFHSEHIQPFASV